MRLLIYAMESSGASLFCYFLGQRPGSIAIVDVWSPYLAPFIATCRPIVAKATTTNLYWLADHVNSFKPDAAIFFLRHPAIVYSSLIKHDYANRFGTIGEKFSRFDKELRDNYKHGSIIHYEDFIHRRPDFIKNITEIGWPCDQDYYTSRRSLEELQEFNCSHSEWLKGHLGAGWGFGNIGLPTTDPSYLRKPHAADALSIVRELAPYWCDLYENGARP